MTKFWKNKAICAVAALAGLGASGGVSAQSGPILTAQVQVADLDLSTPKGQKAMQARFRQAIKQVCPATMIVDPRTRAHHSECRKVAAKSASTQMATLMEKQQLAMR